MYKLIGDPSHNLLEARLWGCLDVAEVGMFVSDLRGHLTGGKLRPGHMMLVDVTGCAIQAQATVNAFHAQSQDLPRASRIAVVTGCSVVRMQARRIMRQPYAKLFDDRAGALAWLMGREGERPHTVAPAVHAAIAPAA